MATEMAYATGTIPGRSLSKRVRAMGATLEEIRSRARKADPRDAAEFANIVKVATELDGVSCRGLARYLMVVPSTVSRWARGRSIPGPLARKTIMDMLGEVDHDRLGNG